MTDFDALLKLREEIKAEGIPTLRDETFFLLAEEIARKKPKKILEIGTSYGVSGLAMLLKSDAALTTVEKDERAIFAARKNFRAFGMEKRVTLFAGDADEIVPELSGSYDFILLDGPKGKYFAYYPFLKEVLAAGGELFADNVLLTEYGLKHKERRNRTAHKNMEAFINAVREDEDINARFIDIEDGVLIAEKR